MTHLYTIRIESADLHGTYTINPDDHYVEVETIYSKSGDDLTSLADYLEPALSEKVEQWHNEHRHDV